MDSARRWRKGWFESDLAEHAFVSQRGGGLVDCGERGRVAGSGDATGKHPGPLAPTDMADQPADRLAAPIGAAACFCADGGSLRPRGGERVPPEGVRDQPLRLDDQL